MASATFRISTSACSLPRISRKCRSARAFPVTKMRVSVALGSTERAAGEEEAPRRVLEHRAVADLHQMLEELAIGLAPLAVGHVADAPRHLGQCLGPNLGVGLPRESVV